MDNNQEEHVFTCPRCGNDVKSSSRYCMKCGYLNPDHPDNKQYSNIINKNGMVGYTVGNGETKASFNVNANEVRGGAVETAFGEHTGNFTLCFILNFIVYILLMGITIFGFYSVSSGSVTSLLGSDLCYVLFVLSLFFLYHYSVQLVYMKMNHHWWAAILPLVNMYALSDAVYGKKLLNFLVFVPVIGEIYYIVLLYKMGTHFKVNGLLTVLFPFIMFPVIGYGGHGFKGVCYVSGRDSLEQEYGKKKTFFVTCSAVIVCSVVLFIYANVVNINKGMDRLSSYYLYFASQRVIRRTQLKVENRVYECDTYGDTLYFYYGDLEDYFSIPFYVYRDPIEAYVKVVITEGGEGDLDQYDYYISMTDKRYGYKEVPVQDLKIDTIEEYPELDPSYKNGNQCYFKRNG